MIDDILKFYVSLKDPQIKIDELFKVIVQDYSIFHISESSYLNDGEKQKIVDNIRKSQVVIFDRSKELSTKTQKEYYIIGFEKTLIIFNFSIKSESFLRELFSVNSQILSFNLSDQNNKMQIFKIEISEFKKKFNFIRILAHQAWEITHPCILGYLIKKGYLKSCKNRFEKFNPVIYDKKEPKIFNEKEYVELRNVGTGSFAICTLAYHIKHEKLFIIKKPIGNDKENDKLLKREIDNYKIIRHPLIPKYYGTVKGRDYIVIEFINGTTLYKMNLEYLSFKEKITVIYELILVLKYLHGNKLIYRDLRPSNIMLDENKTVVLIDFDRLIPKENIDQTLDFDPNILAPEVYQNKKFTYESDVYSLGKMIEYIIGQKEGGTSSSLLKLKSIIEECTKDNPKERPTLSKLCDNFYVDFKSEIIFPENNEKNSIYYEGLYITRDINKSIHYFSLAANQNDPKAQFILGLIYYEGLYITRDINKSIHYFSLAANQNHPKAQFILGFIYYEGLYITRDINKSIHYFSLAANQNDPEAQFTLGLIYCQGLYITRDINKSIHYFSLAANQNDPKAQFILGLIYYEGLYITRDINKSIHYFSLAANQNDPKAQFTLGLIYYEGLYITRDINKSIHYFSLAANQNDPKAQLYLGAIYYEGLYITRDINKSIHYLSLAANQNDPKAQFTLGLIYYEGLYITRDINKSIHYLSLAANQNDPKAQLYLGAIYYEGLYIARDINKSIHYFSLAANQNDPKAQFTLGLIYYEGLYITRDINKSIHYLSLAANQNDPEAQLNLGLIYYEGLYIARDINKSIHYLSLVANQNDPKAQFILGFIYYEGLYITRDINKSIHYFSLAANQNHPKAQFILGLIYYEGLYITRDINKSIHYFSLAANQNHPEAQFNLGLIYYEGLYITRDINKSIHYFSLAANQNDPKAQFILGFIYYEGLYITRDINKSIHYLSLVANQNHPKAQFILGFIYYEGLYITRDINKSIHYFSLAANQNDPEAQFILGLIYYEGLYITRDINKSIHYFSLAANQNDPKAQFNLGLIYYEGLYITRDINKSIHYFSLAANQNYPKAQFILGFIYYEGLYITRDINKSIHYFSLAANQNDPEAQFTLGLICYQHQNIKLGQYYLIRSSYNNCRPAHFAHGFFLHSRNITVNDIKDAIHYYKEASSFNNQYAKNNLGVIYKNGFGDEIEARAGNAIPFFEEAIRQKNDYLSMYNLAHIYIYNESIEHDINKSINLLIKSSNKFIHSLILLCIILKKKYGDISDIMREIKKLTDDNDLISNVREMILTDNSFYGENLNDSYESYRSKDFLYNVLYKPILTSDLQHIKYDEDRKYPNAKDISDLFYEGLGSDIIIE